jgi:secreted trypsin-like serine protease
LIEVLASGRTPLTVRSITVDGSEFPVRLRVLAAVFAVSLGALAVPAAAQASPAIIGGSTVSSAPWAAAVFTNGNFTCSGTIIAPSYVLTATHCISGTMSVRVGSVNRTSGGTTVAVTATTTRYDLALMHLATPVTTTYMTLSGSYPPVGSTNSIYGWGRTCYSGCGASTTLKTATVKVTSTNQKDNSGGRAILSSAISGAAWSGDSGGPELYNGSQVGVASLADGQSQQIYGSVAYNRSWITSVAGV